MDKVATAEFSKEKQTEKLKKYCDEAGYTINDSIVVIDDRKLGHSKLQELLNTAKDNGIEKIIMTSTKCISGTPEELEKLADSFENCGVPIETLDGSYENGYSGNVVEAFLMAVEMEEMEETYDDDFTQNLI